MNLDTALTESEQDRYDPHPHVLGGDPEQVLGEFHLGEADLVQVLGVPRHQFQMRSFFQGFPISSRGFCGRIDEGAGLCATLCSMEDNMRMTTVSTMEKLDQV